MSKPNDGIVWYTPNSASQAVKCCAKTNEDIEVFVVGGVPPSGEVMFAARLKTIVEKSAAKPQAE